MSLLETINQPADLRKVDRELLPELAAEIRAFLVDNVSNTGGHLGPNLGVVELTMALHMVFDSPHDPIIFDTGHQSYVHKILTGRANRFDTLRQKDGLSGYPSRAESEHDWMENSHATTSLSWAEGIARGFRLRGENDRVVIAVIGDGALTGGMAWESLNNIAVDDDLPIVILVNDNGRSYAHTVGGLSRRLSAIRSDPRYELALDNLKHQVKRAPFGQQAYDLLHGMKVGIKDVLARQELFGDLGIKYLGPVDGHDVQTMVEALGQAKKYGGPVIVHAVTRKGHGYEAAEADQADHFHAVGRIDARTGRPLSNSTATTWTKAFSRHLVDIAEAHPEVVAITAAMLHPVGLGEFAHRYPERVFDVGIAEQHAVASAAGMAAAGLHPIVAVYSTFLNRAFDQLLLDVGMHQLGVSFVLDRAGVTGPDGPSHNGVWDVSLIGIVPGIHLASPRDEQRLAEALENAVRINDAPTVIRYSKDPLPAPIPEIRTEGGNEIIWDATDPQVLVVAWGAMCSTALSVAQILEGRDIPTMVVDPVWGLPVNPALVSMTSGPRLVVSIEDNLVVGGLGSQLRIAMDEAGINTPTRQFGIPSRYLPAATRAEVLAEIGLDARTIAEQILTTASARELG